MPFLNRPRIRGWLDDHNWSYQRLADACAEIDPDDRMSSDVVRNAVMGHDPIRPGRIRLIEKVTLKYGDGIPYEELLAAADTEGESEETKEESTSPPKRTNGKGGTGPKRAAA